MRYLAKTSAYVQLLVFIGLYLLCTFSFYGVAASWALPHWFGISTAAFLDPNLEDEYVIGIMKVFQMAYSVFSFLLPALFFFVICHRKPFSFSGLRVKTQLTWTVAGIILLLVSLPLVNGLSDLNQLIPLGDKLRALQDRAEKATVAMLQMGSFEGLLYNLLLIGILPAIAEEFFFRGVLQKLMIKMTSNAWTGIILTSVIFSLVHGEMFGFLPRVALGLVLGLVFHYSGNLWYSIIVHFVNNGFQVVLMYLFQEEYISTDITQESVTPIYLVILSLFFTVGFFILYKNWVPKNRNRDYWIVP